MKKYIVLLLCLIACRPVVVAQDEIDTIPEFYHHYMYQWVDDSAEVCWHDSMLCVRNWSSLRYTGYYNSIISMPALIRTLAAQYEISDSTKIVGIAAVMDTASLGATPDTLSFELSLYKPVGGNMQLLKSDTISVSDFVRKMKMLFLEGEIHCNQEPSSYDDYVRYYSTYEVYFEEPVVMTDSFCIGFTHFYDWEEYECRYDYYPVRLREEHINCRYGIHRMPLNTIRYKLKSDPPDAPWHQTLGHLVLCLMPIVERPCDTCGVVRDFRQQWIADQTLFVQWDTLPNHTSWQLSYCAAGTDPDHGTIVDCPLPQAVVGNVVGGHPLAAVVALERGAAGGAERSRGPRRRPRRPDGKPQPHDRRAPYRLQRGYYRRRGILPARRAAPRTAGTPQHCPGPRHIVPSPGTVPPFGAHRQGNTLPCRRQAVRVVVA